MQRHWNGQTEQHPTLPGAMLSTFSIGVRHAFDRTSKLFVPYPSNLTDARGNAIPANRGWLYDSLSYQGFAPEFADGFSYFINRNTFDHDLYRANLGRGLKGTKPELPETLDFEYRKRPLDAAHVEGIVIPIGETFTVRYQNAFGPGIHREIFFGWQRFADEIVIEANAPIAALTTGMFETLSNMNQSRSGSLESLSRLSPSGQARFESTAALNQSRLASVEALQGVRATVTEILESLGGLSRLLVNNFEATQRLAPSVRD